MSFDAAVFFSFYLCCWLFCMHFSLEFFFSPYYFVLVSTIKHWNSISLVFYKLNETINLPMHLWKNHQYIRNKVEKKITKETVRNSNRISSYFFEVNQIFFYLKMYEIKGISWYNLICHNEKWNFLSLLIHG